jgi:hypothetical protein
MGLRAMRALSATEIVTAWEYGRDKHPVDRALLFLRLACPEMAPAALRNLTVGQRNFLLLDLRGKTLGTLAQCLVKCSQCGAELDFAIDTTTFYNADQEVEPLASTYDLEVGAFQVSFRLPTSSDLASVVGYEDASKARYLFIERCVVQAERDGHEIKATELPETVVVALAKAMLEYDTQAEIAITLGCSECDYSWDTLFDIVSFFWAEIEAHAKRLLREVDALARAYGWREAEILALSEARRQFYLELVH